MQMMDSTNHGYDKTLFNETEWQISDTIFSIDCVANILSVSYGIVSYYQVDITTNNVTIHLVSHKMPTTLQQIKYNVLLERCSYSYYKLYLNCIIKNNNKYAQNKIYFTFT